MTDATMKKPARKSTLTLKALEKRIAKLERQMREVAGEALYAYGQTMRIGAK